jgi:hypothetical protein
VRVGKSGAVACDYCGRAISGGADLYTRKGKTLHFCQSGCLAEYLLEELKEEADRRAKEYYKKEYKLIYEAVCPSCRWRLRKLL